MTKKEFTYALPRGLGRCVLACRKDPEKHMEEGTLFCRAKW